MSAGFRAGTSNDGYLQINGTDILTVSSGVLGVKNTGAQSEMRLYCESNNAHYASLKSPPHSDFIGNVTFTLPGTSGSSGQVLQTDGSGNLSWVNQSGGGGGGGVSDKMSEGNTEAEVVDTGSDGHFKVTTEGVERLRINSVGEVGINNTSPESYGSDGRNLVIGNSSSNAASGITLVSGTGGYSQLYFADGTSGSELYSGTITYNHADNRMDFWTNGVRRLRINSTGEIVSYIGTLRRDVSTSSFTVTGDTASNTGANINLYGASHSSLANIFRVRTGATERLRVGPSGQIGLGGANYGTSGQVLTSGGASGAVSWTTISGGGGSYGNSDVDNHINSGAASSGQILSWNGSDYAWVADQGGSGGGGISDVADDTTPQLGGNLDLNSRNITGTGNISITGTLTSDGISLGDNDKINAGAGNDLQIYHDGTASYIAADDLRITNNAVNETLAKFVNGGSVSLYHNDSKKFETTSDGVDVTGSLTVSSNTAITSNSDGAGGYHTMLENTSTGDLYFRGTELYIQDNANANQAWIDCLPNAGVKLYYAGATKLETTNTGITVTGTASATTFSGSGASLTNLPAANITGTLPAISGANLTNLPSDTPADTDVQVTYDLSANGSSAYRFTGPGYSGADDNPDLYLVRGQRYRFINATGGHPFRIQSNTSGTAYTDGVSGSQTGTQDFNVQYNAPERLYYQCTSHSAMIGNIYIVGASDWRMTDVATSATPEIFTNLNVGIGNSNPTTKLEVTGDLKVVNTGIAYLQPNTVTAFQAYESSGPVKISLNNNGSATFDGQVRSEAENVASFVSDKTAGYHFYAADVNTVKFTVNASGRADFAGRVFSNEWFQSERTIGTDSAFYATVSGAEKLNIRANGSASFAAGAFAIESDGDISTNVRCHGHIELDSSGVFTTPKIKLFSNTGHALVQNLYLGGSLNGGFSYNSTANTLEFLMTNGGTHSELTSNAYVPSATATRHLGYHNKRWDKLFCDGVRFDGNNTESTTLDDYEEGTFTPTVVAGADNGSGGAPGLTIQAGRYIKIGKKVHVDIYIRFNIDFSTGTHARIGNLPFAISNDSYGNIGASNLTRGGGVSTFHNTTSDITTCYGNAGTSYFYLYKDGGTNFIFGGTNNVNLDGKYWIGIFEYVSNI